MTARKPRRVTASRTRKVTVEETETLAVEDGPDTAEFPELRFAPGWDNVKTLTAREVREQRAQQVQNTLQHLTIRSFSDAETALALHIRDCDQRRDCPECGYLDDDGLWHAGSLDVPAADTRRTATAILRAGPGATPSEALQGRY